MRQRDNHFFDQFKLNQQVAQITFYRLNNINPCDALQETADFYFPSWGGTVLYNNETLTIHNPEERYTTKEITDKLQELINQLKT